MKRNIAILAIIAVAGFHIFPASLAAAKEGHLSVGLSDTTKKKAHAARVVRVVAPDPGSHTVPDHRPVELKEFKIIKKDSLPKKSN